MSASLEIRGLAELKDALARLPTELKGQATGIVVEAAYAAQRDIVAQYHTGATGKLVKGVTVTVKEIGPFAVGAQVKSRAPHAWLYEHGTTTRQQVTTGRKTGRMWGKTPSPPIPVFIPTMMRERRAMYFKLAEIIRAAGLTVTTGEP